MSFLLLIALLAPPAPVRDPDLALRISQLLHRMITGDDADTERAHAEAGQILRERELPTIDEVGDEAAYAFVVLTCSSGAEASRAEVLSQAKRAAARHMLASDAVEYCQARIRIDVTKARAEQRPPTHPELRDEIQRLMVADQDVRQKGGFDPAKMQQVDREHSAALIRIFEKHGVPTYAMVGPEAASGFVTMVQHQEPEFRRRVLPKLEANVDAGQADPGAYAQVYDRAARDQGRAQRYGENLECSAERPTLHRAPIEDEANVNRRRARLGLIRVEIYERLVIELSPALCGAAPAGEERPRQR